MWEGLIEPPYAIRLFQGIKYIPIGFQISYLQSYTSNGFHLVGLWARYIQASGDFPENRQFLIGFKVHN